MNAFFDKYKSYLGRKEAFKIIYKEIEKACYADDKETSLKHLRIAHSMIADIIPLVED